MDKEMESLPVIWSTGMRIERVWEMPNAYTFAMQAVKLMLKQEMTSGLWIDPFCGHYSPATVKNDTNTDCDANFHMDGLEWLKTLKHESVYGVLFDPPYSAHQAVITYQAQDGGEAGRRIYASACHTEIARIITPGGKVLCFGWNSNGIGSNMEPSNSRPRLPDGLH